VFEKWSKAKIALFALELTNCAGSAMGPQSDAAGASHRDVASQKGHERTFSTFYYYASSE
jgi:hypothetical protein